MQDQYDNLLRNIQLDSNPFNIDSQPNTVDQSIYSQQEYMQDQQLKSKVVVDQAPELPLFTIDNFISQLKKHSHNSNKSYHNASVNINAYDIAKQCARVPYFRINNFPVEDYSSSWLPLSMRGVIGSACHDFLQSVDGVFSELEVCMKIPSMQISVRADGLINHDTVVEIKSCNYADYDKVLKTNTPRSADFFQAVFYKYLLENHLDEIKQQKPTRNGTLPKRDKYDIRYIQMIYLCHELIASDSETISADIKFSKDLKKKLDSKKNRFWFLTSLTIDLTTFDIQPYIDYILEKYNTIKTSLDTKVMIPMDNKYIDSKECFFCVYKNICSQYQ